MQEYLNEQLYCEHKMGPTQETEFKKMISFFHYSDFGVPFRVTCFYHIFIGNI